MLDSNYSELLEDGKLKLYLREGIFYARVLIPGTRKYKYKSLGTSKIDAARKLALKFFYEIGFRLEENLPLHQKSLNDVIDEYIKFRERDYERTKDLVINSSRQQPQPRPIFVRSNVFPSFGVNTAASWPWIVLTIKC